MNMADQKQWWAPVWKGLVMDKSVHRKRMGSAVWLFLYLLVNADRKTGSMFRKIKTMTADMGITRDTIMRWLVILREGGYIITTSTGRCLSIQINKWRTPKAGGIRHQARQISDCRGWNVAGKERFAKPQNGTNASGKKTEASAPIDNSINKSLNIDNDRESQNRTFKDFIPQDREELLALDLADALNDQENLPLYLSYAKRYPEQLLRSVLGEVKEVPLNKIKKSRGALFNHLVQKYVQQTADNSRD